MLEVVANANSFLISVLKFIKVCAVDRNREIILLYCEHGADTGVLGYSRLPIHCH